MFTLLCAISIQILKFYCKDRRLLFYMSRTLHLFGTDWCAMMVPIQVIRWYRMQCYDGTDSCAIVVPIRRYYHISFITATFNSDKTIVDTMESVLSQTYTDFEYLVIDGGSFDDTIEKVKSYEPRFGDRLRWISEKDRGIYDAMNKGIKMATGDVVGILNSDDYYTDIDILQTVADTFKSNNHIDALYGDIHFVRDGSPDKCVRYYSSRMFSPFWLRFGFMPAHPSFYFKREVFEKAGLYSLDYKIGADYEMMVRLFKKYRIMSQYINKDFVTMRTGGASNNNVRSRITLINEDVKACKENGVYTNSLFVMLKFMYKIFEFRL